MLLNGDDDNEESNETSGIRSVLILISSIIFVTLVVSLGLFISTEISGYNPETLLLPIDKSTCVCGCWDGLFRGRHGRGGYKTFYFNYEKQMIVIVGLFLFGCDLLRRFFLELFWAKRFSFVLLIPAIYSNYYGAWNLINYINDHDYTRMLKSQIFFSVTELVATCLFSQLLKKQNSMKFSPNSIYLLVSISLIHIQIATGELDFDRMQRNVPLILSDIINLVFVTILLINFPRFRPNLRTVGFWSIITILFWFCYHIFFSI